MTPEEKNQKLIDAYKKISKKQEIINDLVDKYQNLNKRVKELSKVILNMETDSGRHGKDGLPGKNGMDGKAGRDGIEISAEDIVKKLHSLPEGKRFSAHFMKDIAWYFPKKRYIEPTNNIVIASPGGSGGGGGLGIDNEIVAGSGTSWTLSQTPNPLGSQRIFAEGQRLTPGAGNDYTISGRNITTANSYTAGSLLADY